MAAGASGNGLSTGAKAVSKNAGIAATVVLLTSCLGACATKGYRTRVLDVPARTVCDTDRADTRVEVQVLGEDGAPLRGIHVHLLQVESWDKAMVGTQQRQSNEQGRVTFEVRTDGYYALVAASIGFTVEERFFMVKGGCDVEVVLPIRVLYVTDVM